jgi:hypothetical protein
MQKLTQDVILKGIQHREVLEVAKLGGSVTIRPLTDGELAEVRSVALRGLSDQAIRQITRIQQVGKTGDGDIDGLTGDDLMQAAGLDDLGIHHLVVNNWEIGVDAPQNVVLIRWKMNVSIFFEWTRTVLASERSQRTRDFFLVVPSLWH